MATDIDDLRARARAASSLVAQLSAEESALAKAYAEATALANAVVLNAEHLPPEERAELNYALPGDSIRRSSEYVSRADDLRQRRRAAHIERCDLDAELEAAELVAAAVPESVN